MPGAITRAQFLRGDFTNQHAPLRPPYSLYEPLFLDTCTQCTDCITVCPENILISSSGNYPEVDFSHGECTFCFQCIDSCKTDALILNSDEKPWSIEARITEQCLVFKGVHCMICREQCESEAISFIPKVGQPPYPTINPLLCSGCGACFQPCPNQSIKLNYQNANESITSSYLKETAL